MSPFDFMMLPLKRYADFSGRARRMEYWMFWVLNIIVSVVAAIIDLVLGTSTIIGGAAGAASALAGLALLIPGLAVTVRRLHDTDKSGWWFFIILIPLIGFIVLLVFMFQSGTSGDNKYGPNPKEGTA